MDAIDWGIAQRVGERIAGSPPYGGVRAAAVQPRTYDFAHRVGSYSGLPVPSELPPLEAVDRPAWIAANLSNMRPLLGPLSERLGDGAGPLSGPLRALSGFMLDSFLRGLQPACMLDECRCTTRPTLRYLVLRAISHYV